MSQPRAATSQTNEKDEELREAQRRAERAEKKLGELEKTVAALKSEQAPEAGRTRTSQSESQPGDTGEDAVANLRREPMMAHLLDALAAGTDIGHYGRLVFAMVAHHFLPAEQVIDWLNKDAAFGHDQAIALLRQVESRDYNPPRRERILAWQAQQEFPILPDADDPDCGNVYRNLKFPEKVYEHIEEYQEEKAEAEGR
jgi:hypothetical protein